MDDLGSWLAGVIGPLAKRVAVALGFGYVTFTGADTALQSALSAAKAAFGTMPGDVGLLIARFGFFDFMSITSGGIMSGLVWMYMKRLAVTTTGGQ